MYIRSLEMHLTLSYAIDEAFLDDRKETFPFSQFRMRFKKEKENEPGHTCASVSRNRRYFRAAAIILLKRR